MSNDDANEILSFFNDDKPLNPVMIKYILKDSPLTKNLNTNLDTLAEEELLRKSDKGSFTRTQKLMDLQVEMPIDFEGGLYAFYLKKKSEEANYDKKNYKVSVIGVILTAVSIVIAIVALKKCS
jgi:hypothetical protein